MWKLFNKDGAEKQILSPGYGQELGYAENAADVQILTADTVLVTAPAITFDGTPVELEFFVPQYDVLAATRNQFYLFEDGVRKYMIGSQFIDLGGGGGRTKTPISMKRRFTPSAGSHTYSIRVSSSTTGATQVARGATDDIGNAISPIFIRIKKA